jgi:hypothetical protein
MTQDTRCTELSSIGTFALAGGEDVKLRVATLERGLLDGGSIAVVELTYSP